MVVVFCCKTNIQKTNKLTNVSSQAFVAIATSSGEMQTLILFKNSLKLSFLVHFHYCFTKEVSSFKQSGLWQVEFWSILLMVSNCDQSGEVIHPLHREPIDLSVYWHTASNIGCCHCCAWDWQKYPLTFFHTSWWEAVHNVVETFPIRVHWPQAGELKSQDSGIGCVFNVDNGWFLRFTWLILTQISRSCPNFGLLKIGIWWCDIWCRRNGLLMSSRRATKIPCHNMKKKIVFFCIFLKRIFLKRIFRKRIFGKCIFGKCIIYFQL